MSSPLGPPLSLALRTFDKLALLAGCAWLVSVVGSSSGGVPSLAGERDAVLAHVHGAAASDPDPDPDWARELRDRLGPPRLEVGELPEWLAHRPPGYLYQVLSGPPVFVPVHDAPAAPEVEATAPGRVRIRWRPPFVDGAMFEGYRVERRVGEGEWETLADLPPSANATDDEDLPLLGGAVAYRVTSRVRRDLDDPRAAKLPDGTYPTFPRGRTGASSSVELARRLYVTVLGVVTPDDPRDASEVQGEIHLWSARAGAFEKRWFRAEWKPERSTLVDEALGISILGVATAREPIPGSDRERIVGLVEVSIAGHAERVREGVRPAALR